MKPIKFKEVTKIYAEDQPEYIPLPVHARKNINGEVISCHKLTFRERLKILFTGKIWCSVWTFNKPLQPIKLTVDKGEVIFKAPIAVGDGVWSSGKYPEIDNMFLHHTGYIADVFKTSTPEYGGYGVTVIIDDRQHQLHIDAVKKAYSTNP